MSPPLLAANAASTGTSGSTARTALLHGHGPANHPKPAVTSTVEGRTARQRMELRRPLENLVGINAAQRPHDALSGLHALHATCADLLHEPAIGDEEFEFAGMVGRIYEQADRHIRPWLDVDPLPTDEQTRIRLAVTVARLCADLRELDGLHPDLRIRQVATAWVSPSTGRTDTLRANYVGEPSQAPCGTRGLR
jgi:hypothetical protein